MLDLRSVTHETFAACVNERFHLAVRAGNALELQLVSVETRGSAGSPGHVRQAFALLFRGPKANVLVQGIHALNHEELGAMELFLVPVGPDDEGMLYEAVFT